MTGHTQEPVRGFHDAWGRIGPFTSLAYRPMLERLLHRGRAGKAVAHSMPKEVILKPLSARQNCTTPRALEFVKNQAVDDRLCRALTMVLFALQLPMKLRRAILLN